MGDAADRSTHTSPAHVAPPSPAARRCSPPSALALPARRAARRHRGLAVGADHRRALRGHRRSCRARRAPAPRRHDVRRGERPRPSCSRCPRGRRARTRSRTSRATSVGFGAQQGSDSLRWDKADYDTWRVWPKSAGQVTVTFDFTADTLDNAMAWTRPDFALFNGTNVFLYPEGRSTDFASTVVVKTEPEFLIATGMSRGTASANLPRGELSRARRHALLRRAVRPRQRDRVGEDGAVRDVSARHRSPARRAPRRGSRSSDRFRPRCSCSARRRGTATTSCGSPTRSAAG